MKKEPDILSGDFDSELFPYCEDTAPNDIIRAAKRVARERVFVNSRKMQIEIAAYSVIDILMRTLCDAFVEMKDERASLKSKHVFALLGVNAPKVNDNPYDALIRIMDFVSGSTDKYAAQLSQRLSGVSF